MAADPVSVEGLGPLRKSLRGVDKDAAKAVQAVTKAGAQIVATQAGRNAPRGTRPIPTSRRPQVRLADSYRASTSGNKGIVRSPLFHARIFEYRKSGTAAQMRGAKPVDRALEATGAEIQRLLEREFDDLARRNGWK